MPHIAVAEIISILQALKGVWPHCKTLNYKDGARSSGFRGEIDRYIIAVQWLTDSGFISFEALMVDARGLSLKDSALTPKGREYSRIHMPAEVTSINERPEIR